MLMGGRGLRGLISCMTSGALLVAGCSSGGGDGAGGTQGTGSATTAEARRAALQDYQSAAEDLTGGVDDIGFEVDPFFNLEVPRTCPDVPSEVLNPRNTWADPAAYDAQAHKLAQMFLGNFKKFESEVAANVVAVLSRGSVIDSAAAPSPPTQICTRLGSSESSQRMSSAAAARSLLGVIESPTTSTWRARAAFTI